MKEKNKGLILDIILYLFSFGVALVPYLLIDNIFVSTAVFTSVATAVLFIFSIIFKDVSIYDPYWSVAPFVMVLLNMIRYNLWNINSVILLVVITIWSIRLTFNWYSTYKGLGNEDWRYAMYREKHGPVMFQLISFTGLHFVPTIVVYAGFISALFAIQKEEFKIFSVFGVVIMLCAVFLEFLSDRAIHKFLRETKGQRKTCNISVWKYSRHPNYLGEMSFWTGLFIYFIALCPSDWYKGLGFLLIIALFFSVSIPMMEKHNLERRSDYQDYKEKTSMIFLLPNRKVKEETNE